MPAPTPPNSGPTPRAWMIREAQMPEIPVLRKWLGIAHSGGPPIRYLVGVCAETGAAVGAGSLRTDRNPDGGCVGRFRLHVEPAWRGRGLARDILATIFNLARSEGVKQLVTGSAIPATHPRCQLFRSVGMSQVSERHRYQFPLSATLSSLEPIARRYEARGLPGGYRLVTLAATGTAPIAAFLSEQLGGRSEAIEGRFSVPGSRLLPDVSRVVLRDDCVVGALVARRESATLVVIEALAVERAQRTRFLSALLQYHATQTAVEQGFAEGIFEADTSAGYDAKYLSERYGGRPVDSLVGFGVTLS